MLSDSSDEMTMVFTLYIDPFIMVSSQVNIYSLLSLVISLLLVFVELIFSENIRLWHSGCQCIVAFFIY